MKTDKYFHVGTWIFRPVILFATGKNILNEEIKGALGCEEDSLYENTGFVDFEILDRLMLLILEKTDNPYIGFELGVTKNMLSGHVLDSMLRSCETVFDIIRKISQYSYVLSNFSIVKETEFNGVFLAHFFAAEEWITKFPVSSRLVRDFIIAFIYRLIKDHSNGYTLPIRICIANAHVMGNLPESREQIKLYGDFQLVYDDDCLVYDSTHNSKMITANSEVYEALESRIIHYLGAHSEIQKLAYKVKAQMLSMEDSLLDITIGQVASFNNLSVRSLQQKLAEENTSFRQIFNEIKIAAIKKSIIDPNVSIKVLAGKMGYANPESLTAFFKRKTGYSPGRPQ